MCGSLPKFAAIEGYQTVLDAWPIGVQRLRKRRLYRARQFIPAARGSSQRIAFAVGGTRCAIPPYGELIIIALASENRAVEGLAPDLSS